MNVVAPFGFYGCGNIGDEATLQGFAHLVRGRQGRMRTWVASQDPMHTAQVEPTFRYYPYQPEYHSGSRNFQTRFIRHLAKAYVFPGGTPIMDNLGVWPLSELVPMISRAQRWGKPVAFVGTGTERLLQSQSRQLVRDHIAGYVSHWSVRCARDRERLLHNGVPPDRVTVAADLAWLLPPVDSNFGEQTLRQYGLSNQRLVGVNINAEHTLLAAEPKLFQKLASLLDNLIESHNLRVVFLCNEIREGETYDKAAATNVQSHMRRKNKAIVLPNDYLSPQQMMSIIASCSLTVSTRYHFCLFSAIQAVPFLAIKRSDKVADLCDDLAWPFGALPGGMEIDELGRQAATLLSSGSQEVRDLPNRVEIMRERAWRNQIALDALDACASTASRLKALRVAFDLYTREKTQDTL